MTTEFDLIARFFSRPVRGAKLGVGDDAAIVAPSLACDLVVTTDTLVCGVHFLPDHNPRALGHKALAVNLSDLAAMGARARWVLLAMTLPQVDEQWLAQFSDGFYDLAQRNALDLIGGDTTRGPLAITVTAIGEVETGKALRRDKAQVGEQLWVSGQIGSAALALQHIHGETRLRGNGLEQCMERFEAPLPRLDLGHELVGVASSAIDISDGLVADAGHLCERSGVGIEIGLAHVPVIPDVMHLKGDARVRQALLSGGDDYELLFTAPTGAAPQLDAISGRLGLALTCIGRVVPGNTVRVLDDTGAVIHTGTGGYEHFV
jgi:thiamine-monophosphate kinase